MDEQTEVAVMKLAAEIKKQMQWQYYAGFFSGVASMIATFLAVLVARTCA